jgi:hypothetical protein
MTDEEITQLAINTIRTETKALASTKQPLLSAR